jgi:hypothetical protein
MGVVRRHGHGVVQGAGDNDGAGVRWPFVLAGGIFVRFREPGNRDPHRESKSQSESELPIQNRL